MSPRTLPRPTPPTRDALEECRAIVTSFERRSLIRNGLSLGSLALLAGCDFKTPKSVETALMAVSRMNDSVQAWLFDPDKLAPTYPASRVLKPPKFNAYYDITQLKPVDGASWRLEVGGLVSERQPWTLGAIDALAPQRTLIIKHICVEGWSYVGEWSGVPLRTFLERIGADLTAPYVAFRTADDYPSSIDMATALHPQTILATRYAGAPITDPFGFPLRLRMGTKLGYKNPKWITALEVTRTYPGGYWESRGFSWFGGM